MAPRTRRSGRLDHDAHDPGLLARLADAGEAVLLEKLECRAEGEAVLEWDAPGGDRARGTLAACWLLWVRFLRCGREPPPCRAVPGRPRSRRPAWRRRRPGRRGRR